MRISSLAILSFPDIARKSSVMVCPTAEDMAYSIARRERMQKYVNFSCYHSLCWFWVASVVSFFLLTSPVPSSVGRCMSRCLLGPFPVHNSYVAVALHIFFVPLLDS